jgi:GNAT superfamily N-acetyltransferase
MNLAPRDARPNDYATFARLSLELKVPDPTLTAEQYEARVMPRAFFLWSGDEAVAYSFWQPLGDVARVLHVVVDPSAQGRGVGAALMKEIGARARRAGCVRWMLNVKPDNGPAIRLYARCGMREAERWWSMEIAWRDVARLPRAESAEDADALESFLVAPEEDARVEKATGLPSGQIATLRAGGGRVFVGLRSAREVVAFAAFDPDFPGAMPFVARTPPLTRRLLEAMQPHAREGAAHVRFATATQAAREAAEDAGARVMVEVTRMEGELP